MNITSDESRQLKLLLGWILDCIEEEDIDALRLGLPDWFNARTHTLN